eukprot:294328-Pleurochrysis_carterae.AAC.1
MDIGHYYSSLYRIERRKYCSKFISANLFRHLNNKNCNIPPASNVVVRLPVKASEQRLRQRRGRMVDALI